MINKHNQSQNLIYSDHGGECPFFLTPPYKTGRVHKQFFSTRKKLIEYNYGQIVLINYIYSTQFFVNKGGPHGRKISNKPNQRPFYRLLFFVNWKGMPESWAASKKTFLKKQKNSFDFSCSLFSAQIFK